MDAMAESKEPKDPRRIVVIIKPKNEFFSKAWDSSKEVIEHALRLIGEDSLVSPTGDYSNPSACLFLGVERWDRLIFVLLDIYHDNYQPDEAHLPGNNDLPVISIRLGAKNARVKTAPPPHATRTNKRLEELHDSFGIRSRPPFFEDHANGKHPVYWMPRKSIISSSSKQQTIRDGLGT